MKSIKINTEELIKGMEPLSAIIKETHIIPILECVLIELKNNQITFTGNNNEIGCVNTIAFKNDFEIATCINFSLLSTILKNLRKKDIEIIFKDNVIDLIHDNGDFKLPTFDPNDFVFANIDEVNLKATVEGSQLKNSLKAANRFLLNSELDPMASVSLSIYEKEMIIRSTDKHQLYKEKIDGSGMPSNLLLSSPVSHSLITLLSNDEITIKYNDKFAVLYDSEKYITISLANENYPIDQFDKLLDGISNSSETLFIDKEILKSSLKRVSILSTIEHNRSTKISFSQKDIILSCENKDISSSAKETIECEFNESKEASYNSKLLLEILNTFGPNVELKIEKRNFFYFNEGNRQSLLGPVIFNKNG